jgi:hypothetical protein
MYIYNICTCIDVYAYTYIYRYTYIYVYTYTYRHISINTYIYEIAHIYIHTHLGNEVRTDERAYYHNLLMNMDVEESKVFIYPRMFSIHDMADDAGIYVYICEYM